MVDFFDKIVKYFPKLDDYYILRQEKEHIIVGTKILVKQHTEFKESVFQPLTKITDKEVAVFFLITIAEKAAPLDKLFIQRKLPLLSLNNKKGANSLKDFSDTLHNFVENNFYY